MRPRCQRPRGRVDVRIALGLTAPTGVVVCPAPKAIPSPGIFRFQGSVPRTGFEPTQRSRRHHSRRAVTHLCQWTIPLTVTSHQPPQVGTSGHLLGTSWASARRCVVQRALAKHKSMPHKRAVVSSRADGARESPGQGRDRRPELGKAPFERSTASSSEAKDESRPVRDPERSPSRHAVDLGATVTPPS